MPASTEDLSTSNMSHSYFTSTFPKFDAAKTNWALRSVESRPRHVLVQFGCRKNYASPYTAVGRPR
jgi:hypothetical protein